ncbi:AAA domain-containing protein [Dichotomocladium elegans]|nr:AAA domain-containing protein [Dichotomocladium elegans]
MDPNGLHQRRQIRKLLELLERKNANPNNVDLETQFFNEMLGYLLSSSTTHWWCDDMERPIARESLWLFSLPDHEHIIKYKEKLSSQLQSCTRCLQHYYASKPALEQQYKKQFSPENVTAFFSTLNHFDRHRVMTSLRRSIHDQRHSVSTPFHLSEPLICAIYDILNTPSLLQDNDCDQLLCDLYDKIHENALFPTFSEEVANNVVILTFHHHRTIRSWARRLLEKFATDGVSDVLSETLLHNIPSWLSRSIEPNQLPFKMTMELSEKWKAFRALINLISPEIIINMVRKSRIFTPVWLSQQVADMAESIVEVIKTLATLFRKLSQRQLWDENVTADEHYNLIKQICDLPGFQHAMKIARNGSAGKIRQRDGTPYPEDKLIARITGLLEWITLYWQSIGPESTKDKLADRLLDLLLLYFQLDVWSIHCKAYCCEAGCQIIEYSIAKSTTSISKVSTHAKSLLSFACSRQETLPAAFQSIPERARKIIKGTIELDAKRLREVVFGISNLPLTSENDCVPVWDAMRELLMQGTIHDIHIAIIPIAVYSDMAIADFSVDESKSNPNRTTALHRIHKARQSLSAILTAIMDKYRDIHLRILECSDMVGPLLRLATSTQGDIRGDAFRFLSIPYAANNLRTIRQLFTRHPQRTLEEFARLLDDFNNLAIPLAASDAFGMVPHINQVLSHLMSSLVGDEEGYMIQNIIGGVTFTRKEHDNTKNFWNTCWRTISLIFATGTKWSETHKPRQVVDVIMPVLDVSYMMIGARQLFQKSIDSTAPSDGDFTEDSQLQYDSINATMDSLSQWIYVTRTEVLRKLVPVLVLIMKQLSQAHIKISFETYDCLMSAATGATPTRLSDEEKENLFRALSAHEPTNRIFLDDSSDEENFEWQVVDATSTTIRPSIEPSTPDRTTTAMRQLKLGESFLKGSGRPAVTPPRPSKSKITSYFGHSSVQKEQIDPAEEVFDGDFDMDDGFDNDMDLSEIPEEWLEGRVPDKDVNTPKEAVATNRMSTKHQSAVDPKPFTNADKNIPMVANRPGPLNFAVQPSKPTAYAVTSTGRKLRPPPMGFSKMKALRQEFRAEQRLIATAKSPSASFSNRRKAGNVEEDSDSSISSSDDEGGSGLQDLVDDMDRKRNAEEERASVKALFERPANRSTKLIETPASKAFLEKRLKMRTADERRRRIAPDIDWFFKTVLKWDVTAVGELPPHAPKAIYQAIKYSYDSFDEYLFAFQGLLLMETWMQLVRARESLSEDDIIDHCMLESRCHVNDFVDVTLTIPVSSANNLVVDDLVCVANHFGNEFFRREEFITGIVKKPSSWHGRYFLGKISNITQRKGLSNITMRCYFSPDQIIVLNSLTPKTQWRMLRLMSLTTAQREYTALQGLQYYDLVEEILHPQPTPLPILNDSLIHECISKYGVNESQAKAIAGSLEKKKGFTLIQGPPGTGKTKTILGLIVSLLDQTSRRRTTGGTEKILVCAPSNAAVDEIAKRLKDGVMTAVGLVKPKIVRIGTAEAVNASVKDVLLDKLIEKEFANSMDGEEKKTQFSTRRENLNEKSRQTQLDIEEVDRKISECGADVSKLNELRNQRRTLVAKRNGLRSQLKALSEDQRDYTRELELSRLRARQKIFASVDIVCATLSGSGHEMFTNLGLSFQTVIVDEAAQSIEISSLIPLKYDCQRCILVGDPNQLPPTVLSQMATKYRYDQSLFMRLENAAPDNVYLLNIQYRMHPAISAFPSNFFYKSLLHDAPDMAKNTAAPWHSHQYLSPYLFFNVEEGQERTGAGRSVYNAAEAEAAVALVDMLATKMPGLKIASRIGIITPYKQQLSQLKLRFEKRYGSRIFDVIDFNTVDGFQGQEKDIIIFSCVRAMSERGIGFLADIRRMNVGLTRARSSLFVLGHKLSLMKSQYWGDLVRDAQERDLLVDIRPPYFQHRMIPKHIPPNLFEKEVKITGRKRHMSHSVPRAKRIAIPSAESADDVLPVVINTSQQTPVSRPIQGQTELETTTDSGNDRSDTSDITSNSNERPSNAMDLDQTQPNRNIRPIRREPIVRPSTPQPSVEPRHRLTLAEYRAAKGLPPATKKVNVSNAHTPIVGKQPNLFIQKHKAKQVTVSTMSNMWVNA